MAKARPIVLEPIVNLDVNVPEHNMGDVTGGLAGKRARINGTDSLRGGELVIKAQAPLAELIDYQTELQRDHRRPRPLRHRAAATTNRCRRRCRNS